MKLLVLLLVMSAGLCFADGTETQTDWSAGPGTPGPVTTFGTAFDFSSGVDFSVVGEAALSLRHEVDDFADAARWTDCADIDGDGDMDLLVGLYSADSLVWYENLDGEGFSWETHHIGAGNGPSRVVLADMDNDLDMDAVVGYFGSGTGDRISWHENDGTGGGWTQHDIEPSIDGCRGVVVRDMDDDGFNDVIAASYSDDYFCWYQNDGTGITWTKHDIGTGDGPRIDDAMDLDYDGDIDIVVGLYSCDSLCWYENEGIGNPWVRHTVSGSFDGSRGGRFNDFNGDTFIDIMAPCGSGDSLCWFENSDLIGTSWTRHTIAVFDFPWMANTADIDDDGDSDVMVCGYSATFTGAIWYENNGTGSAWTEHIVYSGATVGALTMFIGAFDINQDGVMDAVVTQSGYDEVAWHDLLVGNGVVESSILDAQEDAGWTSIDWTAATTGNNSAEFQVRSSDDSADMGDWSSNITSPGSLSPYTTSGDDFIQYRALMHTDDVADLPVLEDITISWTFVSIEHGAEAVEQYTFGIVSANPCRVAPVISFSIPVGGRVKLDVFDVSGRIVHSHSSENLEAGSYQVTLDSMSPGAYFIRMNAGEFSSTEKLVVIR